MRLIDADALKNTMIETLEAIKANPKMNGQEMHVLAAFATVGEMIDDAPTVEPVGVVTAHYIPNGLFSTCSNCGNWTRIMKKYNIPNYCPACGAKMEATE